MLSSKGLLRERVASAITHGTFAYMQPPQTPLRAIRENRGLTLHHVATNCGIDPGTLSRIETGRIQTKVATAQALACFYKQPVDALFPHPCEAA